MEHKDAVGHGYNIGTGTFTNLLEVYRIIGELYGKSVEHDFKEARKGDIKHSYADISNLKALGFVPKYTVETGLKDYFNFEVDNIEEVTAKRSGNVVKMILKLSIIIRITPIKEN